MLSSLRRNASGVEAYECPTCGRPLLTKDATCPLCAKHKANPSPLASHALYPSSPPLTTERAPQAEKPAGFQLFPKLLTITSIAGIALAGWLLTGPDLRTNLFQSFIILALSLLLKRRDLPS